MSDMNKFIGYVTTVADVTQKSAESVGESFKTIYSRFGNVKANKFAATYEDQNSEDYSSEEFENLNDIETVLDRVGIKLRDNASTWRDIDTVLEEIAENWKTWDRTTQNAVATAVAGTRQRENVITLFENWDNVAKYAEIAENAYGTATEKMEAYTDSIEASKQRMTTAVEEWSLKLNQSDTIKAFYDQLAFLIKNIHVVALSIAGIGIATNFNKVTTSLFSGLTSLSNKLINIGNMWGGNWRVSSIKNTRESAKYGLKGAVKNMKDQLEQNYLQGQQRAYAAQLDSYTAILGDSMVIEAKKMQSTILNMNAGDKSAMAQILSANVTDASVASTLANMSAEGRATLAEYLLADATDDLVRVALNKFKTEENLTGEEEYLALVTKQLADKRAEMGQLGGVVAGNVKNSSQQTLKSSLYAGAGSLVGMALGFSGGNGLGDIMSSLGLGDTGKTIGTMLGGTIGMWAGPAFSSALAAGSFAAGPFAALAGLALTTIHSWVKKYKENLLKEAQEEFKAAEEKLSTIKSMSATAAKFDELSKGVDKLGKNVSLSEEEYQSFLDVSNQLCDTFPELLGYMDEEGNKIAKIGEEAKTASEYIEELTKDQQYLADLKLTDKTLVTKAMQDAADELNSINQEVENAKNEGEMAKANLNRAQSVANNVEMYYDEAAAIVEITDLMRQRRGKRFVNKQEFEALAAEAKFTDEQIKLAYQFLGIEDWQSNMNGIIGSKTEELDWLEKLGFSGSKEEAQNKAWEYAQQALAEYNRFFNQDGTLQREISAQTQIEALEKEIATYGKGHARLSSEFQNLDNDVQNIIYSAIETIDFAAEKKNGKMKEITWEEYTKRVDEITTGLIQTFKDHPELTQLALGVELAPTIANREQARQDLLQGLLDSFMGEGTDGEISDAEMDVIVHLGFKYDNSGTYDTNNFTDTTDKKQQLADALGLADTLGMEKGAKEFNKLWKRWKVDDMSPQEFNQLHDLVTKGMVGRSTSLNVLRNLMRSDPSESKTKEESEIYNQMLLDLEGDLEEKVKRFYTLYGKGGLLERAVTLEDVSGSFSTLPENLINAIFEGVGQGKDFDEAWSVVQKAYGAALIGSWNNLAKSYSQYAFAGIEDKNGDEILGEWSEIWEMIDATTESYNLLNEAQKEFADKGTLSWQTALKIMQSNPDYGKFLQIGTDAEGRTQIGFTGDEFLTPAMLNQLVAIDANATAKNNSLKERQGVLEDLMKNTADPNHNAYKTEYAQNAAMITGLEWLKGEVQWFLDNGYDAERWAAVFGSETLTNVQKLTTELESLNKEYEQMMGYGSTGNPATWMEAEYYEVKENNLDTLITNANNELTKKFGKGYTLAQILDISSQADREEYLGYYNDIQKYTVERKNLDDEQAQDAINILKGKKADLSQVAEAYWDKILTSDTEEEFYENYQQYLDAYMADFDKKIADIQYDIDVLEKSKPQEWRTAIDEDGKILEKAEGRIDTYYTKMGKYYQDQYNEAAKALENVAFLTEDEIKKLVNQANDSLKKMQENEIAKAEAIKDYQEKVYSALRNEVNRYIDDLNDQKKVIEEIYDTELEKLKDKEDAISRTNKLIELQNNLLNAQKEKERVYRAGIGWTYESNRSKVREAEKQIDDFYRQDNIDDLNNAKDAELKNLEDRVQNWQKYLDMLEEQYKEYEVAEEKRLLKELLGVETDEQIKNIIVKDLNNFVTQIGEKYDLFTEDQSAFYSNYHSEFSTFLDKYAQNLGKLAELKGTELKLMSLPEEGGLGLDLVNWEQVDYSDKADNADTLEMVDTYLRLRTLKAMNKGIDISGEGAYRSNEQIRNEWLAKHPGEYSNGILGGPVSYTGLAMLHGSPSKPEYVLNNDQAYNLLRYMSTTRMPAFNSTRCGDSGTQYIVQGDIILEGVNNPQEFWGEVTKAMGNRWNVTKNR